MLSKNMVKTYTLKFPACQKITSINLHCWFPVQSASAFRKLLLDYEFASRPGLHTLPSSFDWKYSPTSLPRNETFPLINSVSVAAMWQWTSLYTAQTLWIAALCLLWWVVAIPPWPEASSGRPWSNIFRSWISRSPTHLPQTHTSLVLHIVWAMIRLIQPSIICSVWEKFLSFISKF